MFCVIDITDSGYDRKCFNITRVLNETHLSDLQKRRLVASFESLSEALGYVDEQQKHSASTG